MSSAVPSRGSQDDHSARPRPKAPLSGRRGARGGDRALGRDGRPVDPIAEALGVAEKQSLLEVESVTIERSGLPVVRELSLAVEQGKVTVVLGANGAGKTTLLEGISGAVRISAGQIRLGGTRINRLRPWRRARAGLAHVEQNRTVFRELSVVDNLVAGCRGGSTVDEAFELFPELAGQRDLPAGLLSGGQQQMLVLGRALLGRPGVLLIDEMSLGLAPMVVERLARAVSELAATGVGVLLVEQFASLALSVADDAYVLARGEVVFRGPRADLLGDEDLLRTLYLGDSSWSTT